MSNIYVRLAPYSGRPSVVLRLYMHRDRVSGNTSNYAYELTARASDNLLWDMTPFPWSLTIRSNGPSGEFHVNGSAHLDFRGPGENVDVLARGTTPWFTHRPHGKLELYPAAQHVGTTQFGAARIPADTFAVDRIPAPPPMIAQNITWNAFDATWSKTAVLPPAERWELQLSTREDFAGAPIRKFVGRVLHLSGLKPGTTYYLRMRAATGSVVGPWSNVTRVRTVQEVQVSGHKYYLPQIVMGATDGHFTLADIRVGEGGAYR